MSYWDYERRSAIRVVDGIKAQTSARDMNWWAKRWLAALEEVGLGTRLARGRSYARSGQVLSIGFLPGIVQAEVQGSRPHPYRVGLGMSVNTPDVWDRVLARLESDIGLVARMLAGDLPEGLEPLFSAERAALFPGAHDLKTSCSCPDWENPCKHSAAVCYLVAQELHRDPFVLLRLRGMDRQDILRRLAPADVPNEEDAASRAAEPEEALTDNPALFWTGQPVPAGLLAPSPIPKGIACAAHGLGPFPLWRGDESPADFTDRMCVQAAPLSIAVWSGEVGVEPDRSD